LRVDSGGHIVLTKKSGMGNELAKERLAATRVG
jgi:hypothetical protein